MDEKSNSIWRKRIPVPQLLLAWLGLMVVTIMIFFVIAEINYQPLMTSAKVLNILILGAVGATVLLAAGIFIRWACCRRNIKQALFGLACFATVVALFYAEEDWRGKRAWENYQREWEAKGEHFDLKDFVPPPVPDDQNFAMAPVFDATRLLASRKWRNEHRNLHPGRGGNEWDTNLVDPLQIDMGRVTDYALTRSATNGSGDWQRAIPSDLKIWQNYYRTLAVTTNLFPVASQPQLPAQDVLLALGKYDSVIEDLRAAGQRPDSRFPLDYDDEDPAEILLPHLAALKRCSQVLQLRALAELQAGQADKSFADIKLTLRLADSVRTEPFIITHLVRIAILQIALQPVWEGLAEHKWSDGQLAGLDAELAKINFLADYEYSVRSERAAHVKIIDWMEQERSRYWVLFSMFNTDERNTMNHFGLAAEIYLMPRGWYYQSEITLSEVQQQRVIPMVNDAQQIVSPENARKSVEAVSALRPTAVNLFARMLLPELGSYAMRAAHGQTAANLVRTAIALERYRLAHGEYPETLDVLAPQFIAQVPHDVIGGTPLKYRRTDDGRFVLYSVGWNEKDDGGVVFIPPGGSVPKFEEGDWVWQYPPK